MKKMMKIACYVLAAFITIALLVWLSWRPLLCQWAIRHARAYVREQFKPNQAGYVCIGEDTWAWRYFGGTKGLPVLQELSQDMSLTPCGRTLASNLISRISAGQHLQSFDEMSEGTTWYAKSYFAYIKDQDLRYFENKQSQPTHAGDGKTRAR